MRKSARNQPLPEEEANYLKTLQGLDLRIRVKALFTQGWTLQAIGDPLDRPRSTIRFWVQNTPDVQPKRPQPQPPTPEDRSYQRKRPTSPGISPQNQDTIKRLAIPARKYRSQFPSTHPSTQANQELTQLCQTLHSQGVTIQELADAAGVTYRAMYRRIHRVR